MTFPFMQKDAMEDSLSNEFLDLFSISAVDNYCIVLQGM